MQWTRSRALLVGNVYGHPYGPEQEDRDIQLDLSIVGELNGHGRAPWVLGGDWNRSPTACSPIAGTVMGTGQATQLFGKELGYFRVRRSLPPSTCAEATDIGLPDHLSIHLTIASSRLAHLGYRLRTIQRQPNPPSKDSTVVASPLPSDLDEAWQQRHRQAEEAFLSRFDEVADGMRGRGAFKLEPRTPGCPQAVDGTAVPEWRLQFRTLSRLISTVPVVPDLPSQLRQQLLRWSLLRDEIAQTPGFAYIDPNVLRRTRNQRWAQWTKDSLAKGAGPLHRWAKRTKADGIWASLHHNSTSCALDPRQAAATGYL